MKKDLTNFKDNERMGMSKASTRAVPALEGIFIARNPGVPMSARLGMALVGHRRTWAFLLAQSLKLRGGVV